MAPVRMADSSGPSVLLVVLDTTSAAHLSTYGYTKPTSPHLTDLARRSLLYKRALATASWTLPSHASIFSGLYPSELGFDGTSLYWGAEIGSIAGDLEAAGREAHAISANPMILAYRELQTGFRRVWGVRELTQPLLLGILDRVRHREGFQSRGSRVTDLALDWVDRLSPKRRPWFLFLNYLDPHAPYDPPQHERQQFAPGIDPGSVAADTQEYNSGRLALTPRIRAAMSALYDGEVAAEDAALGRLLKELGARGYNDSNLLVIVTADHGESLGEHGFVGHLLGMPDVVLQVPLLLSGPGIRPGQLEEPVQLNQLRATVRALLALPPIPRIAPPLPPWGPAPSLLIAEHPGPRWYLDELQSFNPHAIPDAWRADWVAVEHDLVKVVFDDRGHGATYDLHSDPTEDHPRPLSAGVELVQAYRDRAATFRTVRSVQPTEGTIQALRQLGYLH